MIVLGVNKVLEWCQIVSNGRRYTCPTKEINGQLFFNFKRAWHPVADFISEYTRESVREGGKIFSRPFSK